MSCNIAFELTGDPPEVTSYLDGHTIATTAFRKGDSSPNRLGSCCGGGGSPSTKINLLKFLLRILYIKRLRLIKYYMATLVTVLILLFFFRSTSEGTSRQEVIDRLEASKQAVKIIRDSSTPNHDFSPSLRLESIKKPAETAAVASKQIDVVELKHASNATNFLSMKDFYQIADTNSMQIQIREATKHSWDNYRRYAWGFDMLKPRSREPEHWFNLGLTIVDSADTLIIVGLPQEANAALDWVENELRFSSTNQNSNCFEMTIRILAGILSAYHLTRREGLRDQAIRFGDILLHCYNSESKIVPFSDIDLATLEAHGPAWNPHSSLAEVASIQLEFRYLSQISGNTTYEQTTFATSQHLHNITSARKHTLLPMYINPKNGQLEDSLITMGARSDSYYEYLLKQYLQTGIKWLEDDYLNSVDEIESRLLRHTDGIKNFTYVAELQIYQMLNNTEELKYVNKMDHLVCFLPGTLALGYYHFSPQAQEYRIKYNLETPPNKLNHRYDKHLAIAQGLARTCYHMYSEMGTGLAPEIAHFVHAKLAPATDETVNNPLSQEQPELQARSSDAHNILRPEFVESLFYLYHITGSPAYREQAKRIFEAFQKYSRISTGYSPVSDVREKPASEEQLHQSAPDRMESFWLSETLKYLYLIFCDDQHVIGTMLNNYVLNTEGHMIPIFR